VLITVEVITSKEVAGLLPVDKNHLHDYAVYVFESSGFHDVDVNIVFVDDERMTALNETYKKRTGTTDVLSFNLSDNVSGCIEGEVYVSLERAEKQAADYTVPFSDEVVRLVTHGLLHIMGRVHDTPDAFKAMVDDTDTKLQSYKVTKRQS